MRLIKKSLNKIKLIFIKRPKTTYYDNLDINPEFPKPKRIKMKGVIKKIRRRGE